VLAEEHREVLTALRKLSQRQREVVVLRYWADLSEAEIAETLGISRGAVKSTASRALVAIHEQLGLAV
jgi:RNA polymerase sigma factor (sigma-70 family)